MGYAKTKKKLVIGTSSCAPTSRGWIRWLGLCSAYINLLACG